MGVYSDAPDPPVYFQATDTSDCVRYTDPSQAQWFMDRINYAFGGTSANVRFDTDGVTIRWFGYYWLHLGDWLYHGDTAIPDDQMRASQIRPIVGDWSSVDTGTVSPPPATPPTTGA